MKFKVIILFILLLSIQNSNSDSNLTKVDDIFLYWENGLS